MNKPPTQDEANRLLANDQARRGVAPFMPFYVNELSKLSTKEKSR